MSQNVLLIGATGFIGAAILNELLNRGHKVTAVARNTAKIAAREGLTVVSADVADVDRIAELAKGKDAVISAYNPGWGNPDQPRLIAENCPRILEAVRRSGVKRLLIVGGAGTLFCAPGLRVVDAGVLPAEILDAVREMGKFHLNVVEKERELDWVYFSPAGEIAPGERTGTFRLGKDDLIVDAEGKSHISVEDYALAMVDELERHAHSRERFTIGY